MEGRVGRLVIAHKDWPSRFRAELVFALCEMNNVAGGDSEPKNQKPLDAVKKLWRSRPHGDELYKASSDEGNPNLGTVMEAAHVLGVPADVLEPAPVRR